MGLITAYLGGYLILFRRDLRFPHALFLIPLGLAAIWVVNVGRIAVLILIGDRVSPTLAIGGFHSQAGWLGFNLVALTLVFFVHHSSFCRKVPNAHERVPSSTGAYLSPLLAAVTVKMLSEAFVTNPAVLYPARVLVAGLLLWQFWPQYAALRAPSQSSRLTRSAWGLGMGVAVFLLWIILIPMSAPLGEATGPARGLGSVPNWVVIGWVVAKVIGFVLVTPLVEELAFRGYLMRRLIARDFERVPISRFTWISFLTSSALFGLLHGQWLAGTIAGMGYALVVYRTGRLRDAVIAHAVTNALLLGLMAYTGNWQE
jgi:exosortase E/protease (VPEID-CTERM system)